MRLSLYLVPYNQEKDQLEIPCDFRRHFMSFIKMMLENTEVFKRFQLEKPGFSPYVFGVGFNKITNIDREKEVIVINPPVYMEISSGIPEIIASLANGALRLHGSRTVLNLKLISVNVPPLRIIRKDSALFKIKGHAVLRGADSYLDPENSTPYQIEEALNTQLERQVKFFNDEYHTGYSFSPVSFIPTGSLLKKGVCEHYGGKITTVTGTIALKGQPEMLNFIYNFGLGIRTGQGFGLVNVVQSKGDE